MSRSLSCNSTHWISSHYSKNSTISPIHSCTRINKWKVTCLTSIITSCTKICLFIQIWCCRIIINCRCSSCTIFSIISSKLYSKIRSIIQISFITIIIIFWCCLPSSTIYLILTCCHSLSIVGCTSWNLTIKIIILSIEIIPTIIYFSFSYRRSRHI